VIDMPRPPTALSGFGFPAVGVTMTTITFGFFAVLIARELPGRQRVWPYLVSGAVVAVLGFARLYLGAHWLTDLVGGMLLGVAWLLALGIAYRRHVARSFWMRPLAALFYGAFLVAALWHAPRAVGPLLDRFAPLPPPANLELAAWWEDGWAELPGQRNERDASRRWPLDVQVAGPLARRAAAARRRYPRARAEGAAGHARRERRGAAAAAHARRRAPRGPAALARPAPAARRHAAVDRHGPGAGAPASLRPLRPV